MTDDPLSAPPARSPLRKWELILLVLVILGIVAVVAAVIFQPLRDLVRFGHLQEEVRRLGGSAKVPSDQAFSPWDTTVVHVRFHDTHINPADFARLARLPAFALVSALDLSGTGLPDSALAPLEGHPKITALNLSGTGLTDEGLRSIIKIPFVMTLNLSGTVVTDEGLDLLIRHRDHLRLRSLDLNGTEVTPQGVREIWEAFDTMLFIRHFAAPNPAIDRQH